MAQPTGIHARRAALRLLDAVLRRGETLDVAFGAATKDVRKFEDKALARAIASEVLRWLVNLDALIDSATKKPLPDDAKARTVLRMMLAQWLRLDTPPHADIATCLPLLAGGPRRLAHGACCGSVIFNSIPFCRAVVGRIRSTAHDPRVQLLCHRHGSTNPQ